MNNSVIGMRAALADLSSAKCACGEAKAPKKSHCKVCYFKLPKDLQRALYSRLGAGYEEAYTKSLQFLGLDSPTEKRIAELQKGIEICQSGFGGVLPDGRIVDRREHPEAVAMAENAFLGLPKPNAVNTGKDGAA